LIRIESLPASELSSANPSQLQQEQGLKKRTQGGKPSIEVTEITPE
jgi:hypothetical protein